MVEASTAEEARGIMRADLDIDPGSYDDHLEPVETRLGEIPVAVAEHVIALMFAAVKAIPFGDRAMRCGPFQN